MPRSTRLVKSRGAGARSGRERRWPARPARCCLHLAGAVLFYGGLAAEVLLFAGIGEQLVARLAARFRLVATIAEPQRGHQRGLFDGPG